MTKRKKAAKMAYQEVSERVHTLMGGYGAVTRFAESIGMSVGNANRMMNGHSPLKEYVVSIVELLEVVKMHAPQHLPDRWQPKKKD